LDDAYFFYLNVPAGGSFLQALVPWQQVLLHVCVSVTVTVATALPLDLLVVALPAELLYVLFADALLSLTLLLEDLYGLVERLDGRPLHLDLLH